MAEEVKPKAVDSVESFRTEARADTADALQAIRDGFDSERIADRIAAGKIMLEFAWGKPAQSVQHTFGDTMKHKVFHLNLTDSTGIGAKWLAQGDDDEDDGEPCA